MININIDNLNPLEEKIYNRLLDYSKDHTSIKITEAADLCQCSTSKISKFVKKIGFSNFKQYVKFLNGETIVKGNHSSELNRLQQFIDSFDSSLVDEVIRLIHQYDRIILFGYGPSLLAAQYFEYRLRTCSSKTVMALSDEVSVASMLDESTLLLILTVTGSFHSFQTIYDSAHDKSAQVAIIVEEYNTELFNQCDRIFWLSKFPQPGHLLPYEKSRTIFFIFIEEIILQLQEQAHESE